MFRLFLSLTVLLAFSLPAQANSFTKCNGKVIQLLLNPIVYSYKVAAKNCKKLDTGFDQLADEASETPNASTTQDVREAYVTANFPKSIARTLKRYEKAATKIDKYAVKKGCVSYFDAAEQYGDQDGMVSDELFGDEPLTTADITNLLATYMNFTCKFAAPVAYTPDPIE